SVRLRRAGSNSEEDGSDKPPECSLVYYQFEGRRPDSLRTDHARQRPRFRWRLRYSRGLVYGRWRTLLARSRAERGLGKIFFPRMADCFLAEAGWFLRTESKSHKSRRPIPAHQTALESRRLHAQCRGNGP